MLILLLIILTMLTAICFLVTTRGKSYTFAVDDQSGDRESSNSQGQGTILYMVIILSDHLPHINIILQVPERHWWSQCPSQTQ